MRSPTMNSPSRRPRRSRSGSPTRDQSNRVAASMHTGAKAVRSRELPAPVQASTRGAANAVPWASSRDELHGRVGQAPAGRGDGTATHPDTAVNGRAKRPRVRIRAAARVRALTCVRGAWVSKSAGALAFAVDELEGGGLAEVDEVVLGSVGVAELGQISDQRAQLLDRHAGPERMAGPALADVEICLLYTSPSPRDS